MDKNECMKKLFLDTKEIILKREKNLKDKDLLFDGIYCDNKLIQIFILDIENYCYYVSTREVKHNSLFILKTGKTRMYYVNEKAQKDAINYFKSEIEKEKFF